MNLGQRRPDGLVPGLLQVPYLYLVYRINGQYQVKTGTYLVGTPEIWLGTILNAGGREGDFFHRLIVLPFLKGQSLQICGIRFACLRMFATRVD